MLLMRQLIKRLNVMAHDPYTENLFEWIPVTKKEGLINMIENVMRATRKTSGTTMGKSFASFPVGKTLI